jgi:hypothetical protein
VIDQKTKARVSFDCVIKGVDRKVEGPTVSLVERVLEEAGFGGEWVLKDSRRIRKKGRGRFSVIRMESRFGAKSIRMWCKPKGNDTCFEYSLYPPSEANLDEAFSLLEKVNPITLSIPESALLPRAFFGRVLDLPQPMIPPKRSPKLFLVEEPKQKDDVVSEGEACGGGEKAETVADNPTEEKITQVAGEETQQKPSPEPNVSLAIDDESDLWDRDVADKALLAISLVAEGGFAKKAEASASIIRNLEIERFSSGGSECYQTVQGAMRALTMALWKKWRYIDRVRYATEDGKGASDTIRGYQITAKGSKRLETLGAVRERTELAVSRAEPSEPSTENKVVEASPEIVSKAVSRMNMEAIKEMVAKHESANRQINEVSEVVQSLDGDLKSMGFEMEGLEAVESERRKRLAEINLELEEIIAKKNDLAEKIEKKRKERLQWVEIMEPHLVEKNRIESILVDGRIDT